MLFRGGGGREMGKRKSNFIFFVLWFLVEDWAGVEGGGRRRED